MNPSDDRLLDIALDEVLGGKTPPDLAERIRLRLRAGAEHSPAEGDFAAPVHRMHRRTDFFRGVGAAAAAALLAVAILWPSQQNNVPRVEIEVSAGEMAWDGSSFMTGRAGTILSLPLLPGDRIRSEGTAGTSLFFKPLGTLLMAKDSSIEVKSMDWKQFGGGAALGGITIAVVSGAVAWYSGDGKSSGTPGDTMRLTGGVAPAEVSGGVRGPSEREAKLEQDLEVAKEKIRELESARMRKAAALEEPRVESVPAKPEQPKEKPGVRFTSDAMNEALLAMDWETMGEATRNLLPLIEELAQKTTETGEIPLDVVGKLQRWNGELISQAMKLVKDGVPDSGINGAFTHPLVVANQIHSLFQKAGVPMTEVQQMEVDALTKRFVQQDTARRSGYYGDTPVVRKILDEMDLKDRFYEDTERLLTPAQQKLMYNDATRGRTSLDIFSSGLALGPLSKPFEATDRTQLVSKMSEGLTNDLGLSPGDAVRVKEIVTGWSNSFPASYWTEHADALTTKGVSLKTQQVRLAAQKQVAMVEALMNTLSLTEAQKKKLLNQKGIYIPYLKK